jgi:hypothetical protein
MGKRSDFARRPMDAYDTPREAVPPLLPHLNGVRRFAEPCCGNGRLVEHLEASGLRCVHMDDVKFGGDALHTVPHIFDYADAIITNPPWTRPVLHALIWHFVRCKPTWLLLDADWAFTRQAAPYLPHCSLIVAVGRLKWIPDSPHNAKDSAAWYRFDHGHQDGPRLIGRAA